MLQRISIHALREEGDCRPLHRAGRAGDFYPRPPRGGRHGYEEQTSYDKIFLSTPSARRATIAPSHNGKISDISIHALREEGDAEYGMDGADRHHFYPRPPRGGRHTDASMVFDADMISIHALREEGDQPTSCRKAKLSRFLSTPSARRATSHPPWCRCSVADFYPRPPRGGRRHLCCCGAGPGKISIHALREEGDPRRPPPGTWTQISIHALREEGDL